MEIQKNDKVERILGIYTKLISGNIIKKQDEADKYNVTKRSIQRDIDDIRNYLCLEAEDNGVVNTVIYDKSAEGYRLERTYKTQLNNSQVLAICKILLDSRAFTKIEMVDMLDRLIECCVPMENQKQIRHLIDNEAFHYVELQHGDMLINKLWMISEAIQLRKYIEISYCRAKDKKIVRRKIKPVAVMFSEYYFYVTGFIEDEKTRERFEVTDDSNPTIYRLDRIQKVKVLEERFNIPYADRFEEGEFRKRVQFMYGGKLQKVEFKYYGNSIDSVLDRLPTAKILHEEKDYYVINAEVFGKGIEIWIRSQGDLIKDVIYK